MILFFIEIGRLRFKSNTYPIYERYDLRLFKYRQGIQSIVKTMVHSIITLEIKQQT